jgi:hypothetical protein
MNTVTPRATQQLLSAEEMKTMIGLASIIALAAAPPYIYIAHIRVYI